MQSSGEIRKNLWGSQKYLRFQGVMGRAPLGGPELKPPKVKFFCVIFFWIRQYLKH